MQNLLRIDSSPRVEGSHSRALADHFVRRWTACHPDGRVTVRDLATTPVPHLTQDTIDAFHAPSAPTRSGSAHALSDALIDELVAADLVVVSAPLHNFHAPSALKAYFDHVMRVNRTFEVEGGVYRGLLRGRAACLLTARGAAPGALLPEQDTLGATLRAAFSLMGFERIEHVALEGTSGPSDAVRRATEDAYSELEGLPCLTGHEASWLGSFSASDRAAIEDLRRRQTAAIVEGDVATYGELCTDDITLMLQGHDAVVGRDAFLRAEAAFLADPPYRHMTQVPLRVERSGDLVVETGRQTVEPRRTDERSAPPIERKYIHVLRATPKGWRFAALLSSDNG